MSHNAVNQTAPLRTGEQFLDSLRRNPRAVVIDGEKIADPSSHPAFAEAAKSIGRLYDFAAAEENRDIMTFPSPRDGKPVLRAYQIPYTSKDLYDKRIAAEKWAEMTFGLMGRTPDHVAGFFCGFAAKPSVFAEGGDQYAENVLRFYEYLRDNHLYVSYAIVPPQIDRSKPAHQQADPTSYAGVVKETAEGIYLSGAQQLATGGVFADYIHLSCIHPLRAGEENYAISLVMPATASGLTLYSRRAFALTAADADEYPLTTRFDETDCMVVLDNVFVPWKHVFSYRNLAVTANQWWKTPAHLYGNLQAQARYTVKLRFLLGLAKRINEMTGNDAVPPVQVMMGELAAYASLVEGMLRSQEVMATADADGVLWPSKTSLYAVMSLQSEINAKMMDMVREMSGAGMLTLPSSNKELAVPELRGQIDRFYASGTATAADRIALMRLAWDFVCSEFGNRHQLYEKFYGGASHLVKASMFRSYDFERAGELVDRALSLPPLGR